MHWEDVWEGRGFAPAVARLALTPASWLYALGWQGYLALYQTGIKRAKAAAIPVVCVGNLQVGGTGKTPVVAHLARVLAEIGRSVVVGVSGYGSPASEGAQVAPDGELSASKWGDEAALLRWLVPDAPLIVGRARVLAADICAREFPEAVLLMDDGFQHLPLQKRVGIVLDPPTRNRRCLPAGPYREPYGNRKRADLVIPNAFRVESAPLKLNVDGPVDVLCALGRPGRFLDALRASGVEIGRIKRAPDHDPLLAPDLFAGLGERIVVTGKDWVKLRERPDLATRQIIIAPQEVRIEPEAEFRTWLGQRIQ